MTSLASCVDSLNVAHFQLPMHVVKKQPICTKHSKDLIDFLKDITVHCVALHLRHRLYNGADLRLCERKGHFLITHLS